MNVENLLVEAIKAGCIHRFEDLVELYKDRVYNMARHMTGCPQEAQDLAQDIFLSIIQNHMDFGAIPPYHLDHRITLNTVWTGRKEKRRRKQQCPVTETDITTAGTNVTANPTRAAIAKEQIEKCEKLSMLGQI